MRTTLQFSSSALNLGRNELQESLGIPPGSSKEGKYQRVFSEALEIFFSKASPVGVFSTITSSEFETIFNGEGKNENPAPLAEIFPRSTELGVFAVTIGPRIGEITAELFEKEEFPLAFALDSAASLGAERTAEILQEAFARAISPPEDEKHLTVRYNPGYCGWDITGQKKLFKFLSPQEIGITLRESSLMDPLKSISGVFISGAREIHEVPSRFPVCSACGHSSCVRFDTRAVQTGLK